jgi:hypothetical protein
MSVPVGPDKELINRAFRIKPVVSDREGGMFFIEPIDLYEKIYTMDGLYPAERANELEKIADIEILMPATLWGGEVGGPTIAQVLPQIPAEYLGKAVAFQAHSADDHKGDNGYVRGTVELYAGELPQKVKDQHVLAWNKTYTEPFPEPEPPKEAFNATAATTLEEGITAMKPLELKKSPSPRPPQV